MKRLIAIPVLAMLAACTSTPDQYAASLPQDDPKWNTEECKQIRLEALKFDNKTGSRAAIGLASGLLLGPFGIPIAVAADAEREDARKMFAREVPMRCSSQPLPKNLQVTKPKPEKKAGLNGK